jgi:radical SAM protein with 4Fe4S-binding SPASM domain
VVDAVSRRSVRSPEPGSPPHPRYVVWELTLRCDHACSHCGSRAGKPREDELSVVEAEDVVDQLAALGTRELALIGGEAYLYEGWTALARRARKRGLRVSMVSGGRGLDPARVKEAAKAGVQAISVSIDGLEGSHDRLRSLRGSYRSATQAIANIAASRMDAYANTQLGPGNIDDFDGLCDELIGLGVKAWQVGFTAPMGRAADRAEYIFEPWQLVEVMPRIAAVAERARAHGIHFQAANNLGYCGPYDDVLGRSGWAGCPAGRYALGIESDGAIKGCPSLPTYPYVGGNVRERSIAELWALTCELAFARGDRQSELWGFCAGCEHRARCRGGCSYTAHSLLGRRGNNPLCHHRAVTLHQQGLAERLVRVEAAPGESFDYGRFEIEVVPWSERDSRRRVALPVLGAHG